MKKLITILGAGLLAFGMFTSCGAKDVNLSWSDEATSYNYECDITALTVADIDDARSYAQEQARKNATTTTSTTYTPKYATVSWSEGYRGDQASKSEGNRDYYNISLTIESESTTTEKATGNVVSHSDPSPLTIQIAIKKVGDKYFIDPYSTARNMFTDYVEATEVTFDGDPEDDEFTFSADIYVLSYVNDWKADGTDVMLKGDTVHAKRAVKAGVSFSNVTLERK